MTGSLAEAAVPGGRAIRKLDQFSLMLSMGLVKGSGGPPSACGHHAPALVASTMVPGGGRYGTGG